ncbi:MAG: glycosyltransferase [Candidatus Helarchaeota archaeon]
MSKLRYIPYSLMVIFIFAIYHIYFPREYSNLMRFVDYIYNNLYYNLFNDSLYSVFYRTLHPLDILGIFAYFGLLALFLLFPLILGIYFFASFGGYKKYDKNFEPKISIIIPSMNEPVNLTKTIDSILASDYPKEKMEILAVISGSDDNSEEILQKYVKQNQPIRILNDKLEKKGKPPALNYGISEAKNELLIFYDAGGKIQRNSIHNLIAPLQDKKNSVTIGPVKVENWNKNAMLRGTACEFATFVGPGICHEILQRLGRKIWLFGRNWAAYKSVIKEVGGFDDDALAEDLAISVHLAINNKKIVFVPNASVYQKEVESYEVLKRQRLRWVYGYAKDVVKLMAESKRAFNTVMRRNFAMLFYAHLPFLVVGSILSTILFLIIQDYYLVLVALTVFTFVFGTIINGIRKYGDKHYSNLLYFPWFFRNIGLMFSMQFTLPETLEWERTENIS